MPVLRLTLCVLALFLPLVVATAQAAGPDPLFADHGVLELRIEAPLDFLMKERPDEEQVDGLLTFTDEAGEEVKIDIKLRTRGNYRRQRRVCPFAPLRLNLKKGQAKDTIFDNQDKLKMVTHCRNNSNQKEQGALREYLTYRMLNELTDTSYQVRLLRITWVATDDKNKEQERFAFLIEHKDRFAHRTGLDALDIEGTTVEALNGEYTNLTSMFQYFAGNTDFSPIAGPKGETCCHNTHLYQGEEIYAVPYDWDMSGIVKTSYAEPNAAFKIRSVRDRLYRGRCVNNEHVPGTLQTYREHKDAIYALIDNQEGMTGSSQKIMRDFVDEFYETIGDEDKVQREIIDECI